MAKQKLDRVLVTFAPEITQHIRILAAKQGMPVSKFVRQLATKQLLSQTPDA